MRQATLCFLVKDNRILLAMKKRGFGQGRWNGAGGKPNPGETIEDTAVRETQEEIGVVPLSLKRVATLDFFFPYVPKDKNFDQQVCVYLVDKWQGKPTESEEMCPKWFKVSQIPYKSMWSDDCHWLPKVLDGSTLRGRFVFDKDQGLEEFEVKEGKP